MLFLRALHWLNVSERIHFKIAVLTFKSLNGLAPSYLADMIMYTSRQVNYDL